MTATGIQVVGQPSLHKSATNIIVNPEYFDSVGTRVLMGRGLTVQDTATSPHVAVVNEDFVKALFKPGDNPIGHRFTAGGDPAKPYKIVDADSDNTKPVAGFNWLLDVVTAP